MKSTSWHISHVEEIDAQTYFAATTRLLQVMFRKPSTRERNNISISQLDFALASSIRRSMRMYIGEPPISG